MPLKQWEDMGHLIGKYAKIPKPWEISYENMGRTNYKWRFIVGESHENVSEFPLQGLITGEQKRWLYPPGNSHSLPRQTRAGRRGFR